MNYQEMSNEQLNALVNTLTKKASVIASKLEEFKTTSEKEIERLVAQSVEIKIIIESRNFDPLTVGKHDWKALFAPIADLEAAHDWKRKKALPNEVERVLALYEFAGGEFRHISADTYEYHTKQPELLLQFDDDSAAKLDSYTELLTNILPHLEPIKETRSRMPYGVYMDINSPRDLDSGKPDGAPDERYNLIVQLDGKFSVWEVECSRSCAGVFATLREALQYCQDSFAFDGSENDYDWELFDVDEFKEKYDL